MSQERRRILSRGLWDTLRGRLTIVILLVALLPLAGVSAYNYITARQVVTDQVEDTLVTASKLKLARVEAWLTDFTNRIETMTTRLVVTGDGLADNRLGIPAMTQQYLVPESEDYIYARTEAFNRLLPFLGDDGSAVDLLMTDMRGTVVYSQNGVVPLGTDIGDRSWYAQDTSDLLIDPLFDVPVLMMSRVIYDAGNVEPGNEVGYLVMALSSNALSAITTDRTELPDSSTYEAYLVNEDGLMITESRFEDGLVLTQTVNSDGYNQARILPYGQTEPFGVYQDYRGSTVIGVATRLAGTNWTLLSEINQDEALEPTTSLLQTTLALVAAVAGLVVFLGFQFARQITRPLTSVATAAEAFTRGDLDTRIQEERGEVGVMARAFNTMADELQAMVGTLEARIAARTKDLETSAEIAGAANQVRDVGDLLSLTVNLIRDRFDLYYTQVYLLDQRGEWAVLRDGTGYVGRKLLGRHHRVPLDGRSLVAQAVHTGQAVVVPDTSQDPNFLPNDLLPDTRSEVAIPLRSQGEIVGVLDIQHSVPNFFEDSSIQLFQSMADQLAVTFDNVQLLQDTARRALELETVAQVSAEATSNLDLGSLLKDVSTLVRDRFNLYHAHIYLFNRAGDTLLLAGGAGEAGTVMVAEKRSIPIDAPKSIVARAAREQHGVIVNDVRANPDFLPHPLLPDTRSEMAVPLLVNQRVVGVLDVQSAEVDRFTDEDVRIKTTLAAQVAVAVLNAQSFQASERRASELAIVSQVSAKAASILDPQELLDEMAILSSDAFDLYHIHIYVADESGQVLTLVTGTGRAPCQHVGHNFQLFVETDDTPVTQAARTLEGVIDNRVSQDHALDWNPFLEETRSQIAIPIAAGERLLGVLEVHGDRYDAFGEEDIRIQRILADQIGTALQNARSFALTQQRSAELQTVAEVSAEASTELDLTTLLFDVSILIRDRFGLYHAHIYLLDDAGINLVLAGGAGEAGQVMVAQGRRIPMSAGQSIVARAARDRRGIIVNDVQAAEDFLPNPLLPETKAEMAVPMIVGENLIGVLDVQSARANAFGNQELSVQTTLAAQIGVAVQNARSFERTKAALAETALQARRLNVLNEMSEAIGRASTQAQVFDVVANALPQMLAADHNSLAMLVDDDALEVYRLTANAGVELIVDAQMPVDGHFIGERIRQGDVAVIEAHEDSAYVDARMLAMEGMRSLMSAAIFIGSRPIGAVNVTSKQPDAFGANEKLLLGQVAAILGSRLENIEALQQVTQQAAIIDNSDDFIALTTMDGVIEYLNPGGVKMMGFRNQEEAIGTAIPQYHTPDDTAYVLEHMLPRALESGSYQGENRLLRPDGTLLDVQQTIFIIKDADGNPANIATIMSDITDRKRQEAEILKRAVEMETVAQVSTDAARQLELERLLVDVSTLVRDRFGLYHAHIYLMNEDQDALVLAGGAGEAGAAMVTERRTINLDAPQSIVARAARDREGVIVNDVTADPDFLPNPLLPETRAEMAIPMIVRDQVVGVLDVQSNEVGRFTDEDVRVKTVLADQVAAAVQNAISFAEMERQAEREREVAERLREVDRLKSQFLANMSHELRTPLNSIIGYSEVLLDGVDGDLPEDAEEDVQAIHDSGKHLLSLINEILDLSKIEAGQMRLDYKEVNLVDFAAEIVKTGQVLVADKPVELELVRQAENLIVRADPIRLRQVLWNLVSNALKFTEEGSVQVILSSAADSMACVTVRDTGIGMSQDDLSKIFDRFSQVDGSSTRRAGGTGLGLTITRQLIQLHGGDISVESELNVGSTFTFTVPLVVREAETEAETEAV